MGLYSQLGEVIRANRAAALATVISGRLIGAKMLVVADGERVGSLHAAIDGEVEARARELLAAERNETLAFEVEGEAVEVFVECFPPPQRLVIIGAVHVAIPLHRLAKMLGYHVTVVDARGQLATAERFPQADSIMVEWPDDALRQLKPDSGTSIVVLTHDAKFDIPALATALQSEARYVGAIGSRTTNEQRFATLREQGLSEEQLTRIYAPVGLDIGAHTPSEIALAVLAEIVAARYRREGGHLRDRQRNKTAV
jgi:xanthine dehydrogenase accessory factor